MWSAELALREERHSPCFCVATSIGCASFRPPPARKSRQVILHRDITGAWAKPYRTCPHTEFQARPGLRSRARGRSGPVPPPRRCLAGCRPITCATRSHLVCHLGPPRRIPSRFVFVRQIGRFSVDPHRQIVKWPISARNPLRSAIE